ncbi:MAG: DUF5069 domain-containing protein [Actinobacteria bacterium]|nr:DUF5069 domain-containing protein [Actinomycetota bacterium]
MDLTKDVPRSPYEMLGGIVFVPRAIDKGRADLAGTAGAYVSRTGRSGRLFDFLGIPADAFIEALRTRPTDADMWAWIAARMTPRTAAEIEAFNRKMIEASPDNGDWDWPRFRAFLDGIGQGHRTDITRHFDRLDLDEGRQVPVGGRRD